MTQIRRFNWLDDDLTASLNKTNQGSIPYGRYYGFDWDGGANLTANFIHTISGMSIIDSDDPITTTDDVGEWRTKQGGIIQETAPITAVFDAPSTLNRIDILVGQHKYVQSTGGASATYLVIKGTEAANPVPPALSLPDQQTILGQMYIPGGGVDLTDAEFTVNPKPNFSNDNTIAHLDRTQRFLEENIIPQMTAEYGTCFLDISNNKIDLSKDSFGISLVGDDLRRNIKKNKFLLSTITVVPTTITAIEPYPHEFLLEAKEIEFFTFSPLVFSGSLFYEHHFNNVQIPAISSFKLLTIEDTLGTGTLTNTWKVINGGEATINGENSFTAINSWNKAVGAISGEIIIHNDLGNYIEVDTSSSNKVKGIAGFRSTGGTVLFIKGDGQAIKFIHDTSDAITKKLWLPHGQDFTSFSEDEVFIFVEDIDYWRLVGTYNQVDSWHFVAGADSLGTTFLDYSNTGFNGDLRFKRVHDNKVKFFGQVTKNDLTTPLSNLVFTLPVGYRPQTSIQKTVLGKYYSTPSSTFEFSAPCVVTILPGGVVSLSPFDSFEQFGSITACVSEVFVNIEFSID